MTALFADTFYWIALGDPHDSAHRSALRLTAERAASPIFTTDEVLTEYLNFFSSSPAASRRQAAAVARDLVASPIVRVIPQSRESFRAGLQLYSARLDKGYSLTDCVSMQTMRQEGLTEALTNDRHFEQEGFHALFR
jgi:predicted nucleic acid-binding protein